MHVWAHSMCPHGCSCLQTAEEGGRFSGDGVRDSCVGAKNWSASPARAASALWTTKSLQPLMDYFQAPTLRQ